MLEGKSFLKIFLLLYFITSFHALNAGRSHLLFKSKKHWHPPFKKVLYKSLEKQTRTKFKFAHANKHYDVHEWERIWGPVANLALAYHISERNEYFTAVRHRLMVMCSYPFWGNPDVAFKNLDLEAALPSIQMACAYTWLYDSLTKQEREKIKNKLLSQAKIYLEVRRGRVIPKWNRYNHHLYKNIHFAAIYFIGRALERDQLTEAYACLDWSIKVLNKELISFASQSDGSSFGGVTLGAFSDHGLFLFLENERMLGRFQPKSKWLEQKIDWYIGTTLPGANEILRMGDSLGQGILPIEQIMFLLADWFKNSNIQSLGYQMYRSRWDSKKYKKSWNWIFLHLIFFNENQAQKTIKGMRLYPYLDQGVVTAVNRKRGFESFYSFICGSPASRQWYKSYLNQKFDYNYEKEHPDQGSFTWFVDGRHILTDSGFQRINKTHHHNTLLINGGGQILEAYPIHAKSDLRGNDYSASPIIYHQHGESILFRGELSRAYPRHTGLKTFDRTLIWLGPKVFIMVDQLESEHPSHFELYFRSLSYPLTNQKDGFYQKVSGFQLYGRATEKGQWRVGSELHSTLKKSNAYAVVKSPKVRQWKHVAVMGEKTLGQDVDVKWGREDIEIEFSAFKYKIRLKNPTEKDWFECYIYEKPFWKISAE